MKKTAVILIITFISLIGACSKSTDQAEARLIINGMTKAAEVAAEKLDKAGTAQEAVEIIKAFKSEMERLARQGEDFDRQHPGINVRDGGEFQSDREAFMNSMKKYGIALMKVRIRFEGAKELEGIDHN